LKSRYPRDVLMPLKGAGVKQPKFRHAGGVWGWEQYDQNKGGHEVAILLMDLCAVDVDDVGAAEALERQFECMRTAPMESTRSGRHYLFVRPAFADAEGYYDGARQHGSSLPVDFKSVCSTGTSGMLVVAPSTNKSWVRPPWEHAPSEIPRDLLDLVCLAKPKRVAAASAPPAPAAGGPRSSSPPAAGELRSSSPQHAAGAPRDLGTARRLASMLSAERAHTYPTWIRVGWCLHAIAPGHLLHTWKEFSAKSPKFIDGECDRLWGEMSPAAPCRSLGMGSLHMWAREDCPPLYRALVNESVTLDIQACNGTHNSVAGIAHRILKDRFVCATANGKTWYEYRGALWVEDLGALHLRHQLSTTVRDQFLDTAAKIGASTQGAAAHDLGGGGSGSGGGADEDAYASASASASASADDVSAISQRSEDAMPAQTRLRRVAAKLQDVAFKDGVLRELREFFFDPQFLGRLDSDPNLLAFTNGVWDLSAAAFRPATAEDHVSLSVGYGFVSEKDTQAFGSMEQYWRLLHPDPAQRAYMKRTLARQLQGDVGQNLFHVHAGHRGSAGNGKSTFFDVLEMALGDYVRKFGVEMLTAKARVETGKPMPEFQNWRGRRILYCTEPANDDVLNSGIMKDLTGGEKIMYRLLFANETVHFRPQFKMHIMCNDPPLVDGADSGIKRRIRKVDYVSQFVSADLVDADSHLYLRDDAFVLSMRSHVRMRMEFMRTLLEAYDGRFDFDMPPVIQSNSRMYLEENDAVYNFTQECVVVQPGAFFTLKQAKDAFRSSDHFHGKISNLKNDLQKALNTACHEQRMINGKREKNVFWGVELIRCMHDRLA
jgi:phage/plasmid-associated DNA primase